ncbi:MAG TPA: hypothetical protein VIK89_04435 [Cytophagaceae bacterium]
MKPNKAASNSTTRSIDEIIKENEELMKKIGENKKKFFQKYGKR